VTTTAWVLVALVAVLAVADWWAVASDNRALEYIAKPATLAVLVAIAIVLHPERSDQRTWFVIALVLSLAGDVFLMLPKDLFVPGLASFLLAHIAYTVGFDLHPGSTRALVGACLAVVAVGIVLAMRIITRVARGDDPSLLAPVVTYMVVISAMVASALAAGPLLAAVGAMLFYASDTLIAWDRFVRARSWMPLAIIVTYHLGQAALVVSLAS
jgi:uncharacterized membrane protein YhhN